MKILRGIAKLKIEHPEALAERHGIIVFRKHYTQSVKGYLVYSENVKFIVVNKRFGVNIQQAIIAHELGHFFHREKFQHKRKCCLEIFAHLFMFKLLLLNMFSNPKCLIRCLINRLEF